MTQNADSEAIINALKGNRHSGMCRCPVHEDSTPSLHVCTSKSTGRVLVKCHAGCEPQVIIGYLKSRGLWPKQHPPMPQHQEREEDQQRFRKAYAVLRATLPFRTIAKDKLRRYLEGRGLAKVPPGAMWLPQNVASTLAQRHPELGLKKYPAMVLPVTDASGMLRGAQLTFLSRDGSKNLKSKSGTTIRKLIGPVRGGFVWIAD